MPENSNHTRICWIVPEQPAQDDPDARVEKRLFSQAREVLSGSAEVKGYATIRARTAFPYLQPHAAGKRVRRMIPEIDQRIKIKESLRSINIEH